MDDASVPVVSPDEDIVGDPACAQRCCVFGLDGQRAVNVVAHGLDAGTRRENRGFTEQLVEHWRARRDAGDAADVCATNQRAEFARARATRPDVPRAPEDVGVRSNSSYNTSLAPGRW